MPPLDARQQVVIRLTRKSVSLSILTSLLLFLNACNSISVAGNEIQATAAAPAASLQAPPPTTDMTWEGCQLTPGCSGDDTPLEQLHDSDVSLQLYNPGTPDPSPGAAGIWVGLAATECYYVRATSSTVGWQDLDADGLRDLCEYRLATAFAPLIAFAGGEGCPSGEPYWAAKFIDNLEPYQTGDMVKLGYLMAYHRDCGTMGHMGDSEFIQLTLAYNYSSQHWEVVNGWLSAHACLHIGCSLADPVSGLPNPFGNGFEWTARVRGFPTVYVSKGKHANYHSESECTGSGAAWLEECFNSYLAGRFRVWESRNLGSAHHPLIDCVGSASEASGRTGTECFWTERPFRGWAPGDEGGETAYSTYLNSVVFSSTRIDATRWWPGSYGN